MKFKIHLLLLVSIFFMTQLTFGQLQDITFEYQYDVEVETSGKKATNLSFLLDEEEVYTGMNMSQAGMDVLVILDNKNYESYSLMNFNGKKTAVKTKMKSQNFLEGANDFSDAEITDLPEKQIAGYKAKGKKIITSGKTIKVYYTPDAEGHFYNIFDTGANQSNYKKLQNSLGYPDNALMLQTTTIDNESGKVESKMTCTDFKGSVKTIKGSEYNIQNALIQN